MASSEPAAEPSLAQESSTPTPAAAPPSAEQEAPPQPQEPVPEAEAENAEKADGDGAEEEEEEGECGFCLYMKAGGCKDTFEAWEECVEAAQKDGVDMVERCHEVTADLKKCMDAHADYYAPLLMAEEAVNERAEAEAAAAAAAAAADAAKDKGGEPATDSEIKEEGVLQPAVSSLPGLGNDEENKEEAVPQPDASASSTPPAGEAKKEEADAEKV